MKQLNVSISPDCALPLFIFYCCYPSMRNGWLSDINICVPLPVKPCVFWGCFLSLACSPHSCCKKISLQFSMCDLFSSARIKEMEKQSSTLNMIGVDFLFQLSIVMFPAFNTDSSIDSELLFIQIYKNDTDHAVTKNHHKVKHSCARHINTSFSYQH